MAETNACMACGNSGGKLLGCGRCRKTWFCNRACQLRAIKELGHKGANCRDTADRAHTSASSAAAVPVDESASQLLLVVRYQDLLDKAEVAHMTMTRVGNLNAVEKFTEASAVANLINGADGAARRADADQRLSNCHYLLGNFSAAARAACSALRAAIAAGDRTWLVEVLFRCGYD